MTRRYGLDAVDLAFVEATRRAGDQRGFAVQLCALRPPGGALDSSKSPPPPPMLALEVIFGSDPVGAHGFWGVNVAALAPRALDMSSEGE